jgi:hypothetical protein
MRSSMDQLGHELAELAPIRVVPLLAAIGHERRTQEDHRGASMIRIRRGLAAIGFTDVKDMVAEDEMGDISVANHHYHYAAPPAAPPAANQQMIAPATPTKKRVTKDDIDNYIKRKVAEGLAKQPTAAAVVEKPPAATEAKADATSPWYKRYALPLSPLD